MIVLVVSPLCLGEGPIVTIKDVLAVPEDKKCSDILEMNLAIVCFVVLDVVTSGHENAQMLSDFLNHRMK